MTAEISLLLAQLRSVSRVHFFAALSQIQIGLNIQYILCHNGSSLDSFGKMKCLVNQVCCSSFMSFQTILFRQNDTSFPFTVRPTYSHVYVWPALRPYCVTPSSSSRPDHVIVVIVATLKSGNFPYDKP